MSPLGLLAILCLGVAAVSVSDPGSRFPVLFMGAVGVLVTAVFSGIQHDRETGVFLGKAMLLAVAIRFLLLAAIHQTVGPYVFAPDQFTYESQGRAFQSFLAGEGNLPERLRGSLQVGYAFLNGAIFSVFGTAKVAPAIVNLFLSCWTAIPVYYLAMALVRQHRRVARLTTVICLFFPSLMLWSVLNIRESPAILAVVLVVYFGVRMQRAPSIASSLGLLTGLVLLGVLREYLTVLVGLGAVTGIATGKSRSPMRSVIVASVVLMGIAYAVQSLGLAGSLVREPSLQRVELLRESMTFGAGSAYGEGFDVSTPSGALAFLPVGLTYFLLAPFPWTVESFLQTVTLPETILWYFLIVFSLRGAFLAFRHDLASYTVPITVLVLVTFAYALVEGNVGTAYRHRAQILPLVFVFTSVGLTDIHARWKRKRQVLTRNRRAVAISWKSASARDQQGRAVSEE